MHYNIIIKLNLPGKITIFTVVFAYCLAYGEPEYIRELYKYWGMVLVSPNNTPVSLKALIGQ